MIGWLGNLSIGDLLILIAGRRMPTGEQVGENEAVALAKQVATRLSGVDEETDLKHHTVLVTFHTNDYDLEELSQIMAARMAGGPRHWAILNEQDGWIEVEEDLRGQEPLGLPRQEQRS